jgi:hypothetical protein
VIKDEAKDDRMVPSGKKGVCRAGAKKTVPDDVRDRMDVF